ncbi:MAG TPA: PVC-type heme-binding CxxCH protein [Pirellulales bacterium]|nr:PVC-type heme-binding CxxCH protein [Pirellulales bacterium]
MNRSARTLAIALSTLVAVPAAFAQRPADEELKSLRVPPGFEASLFASEPMITNPSAIDVDTHGRVWVAEIEWYRGRAKNPPADKLKVLEDTDGDGRADRVTTFAEGLFCPMSVCVAGDKVYVATSPDLWVYEDKNGDLVADGPPRKLLTGFGGHNHDHGAHSLVLGPDHKWWMSHGDTGFDVTGADGSHIKYQWGAMLRGELDGSQLELVAVNFRNPYELCVSSFGESFCSDNDNDGNFSARICWLMEGGDYGWFGHPPEKVPPGTPFGEHWHFRGHVPGFVPATLVTGFGSPCGICFYEGDAFGAEYKNAPLHCDPGPREVRIYRHQQAGYGMKATSRVFVTSDGDNYFRPDDICTAPDGSLYLSDWYDGGVGGHAYNDPERGRIFLLRPAGKKPERVGKPGPYTNVADAIEGLKNPNLATQYLARERLLAEGQASVPALKAMLDDAEPNNRARALWVLHRIGGDARKLVIDRLQNSDAAIRALAVRILRRRGTEYAYAILAMAGDPADEVRREVLLALPKLSGPKADAALLQIASAFEGKDRYQLEAINIAAGKRKAELYAALDAAGKLSLDKIQLLQVLDAKRAAELLASSLAASNLDEAARATLIKQLGGSTSSEAGLAVVKLISDDRTARDLRGLALNLLASNLSGNWKDLQGRPELAAAVRKLLAEADWQLAALRLVGDDHLTQFGADALALAADEKASVEARQKAIEVSAALRTEGSPQTLEKLLRSNEATLRQATLAALIELQDWPAVKQVLSSPATPASVKQSAVDHLIDSSAGALVLLRWIDAKLLSDALREQAIAKAAQHPDSNIRVLYEKFIPEDQRPKRLGAAIKPADILALKGDARRGEQIFSQSTAAQCKTCHRVGNTGGAVGPDLSQIGKKYERATLLETILDPSKAIAPEYVPYLVETEQGRVYVGFVVENNDDRLVLKDAKGQLIHIAAGDVGALEAQKKSIMPDLVLRDVTAQDAADLLAYLTSLKEGVLPVTRFRVLGPFRQPGQRGIDRDFGPEKTLQEPDLNADYAGADGKPCHWELIETNTTLGYPAIDQVEYAHRRNQPAEGVTNYFLVFADSDADQDAQLLLGSDDSCNVWVNGEQVHKYRGDRAVGQADDRVSVHLRGGRNTIVIKVENHQGPGGLALSIAAAGNVQAKTE